MSAARKRLSRVGIILVTLALGVGLVSAGPARAGADFWIEAQNTMLQGEAPGYPKFSVKSKGQFLCWYNNELDEEVSAPPGGRTLIRSEVKNTFLSWCNPLTNPQFGSALFRYTEIGFYVQTAPGAKWQELSWPGDTKPQTTGMISYWKMVNDPLGFHFDFTGPRDGVPLTSPLGATVCLHYEPNPPMYIFQRTITVELSPYGCTTPPGRAAPVANAGRHVAVSPGERTRVSVAVQPDGRRWRKISCTNDSAKISKVRYRTVKTTKSQGPQRIASVRVTGKEPGRDKCRFELRDRSGSRLAKAHLIVNVRR